MLYLVATPIGNLEDITLRALKVLQEVDYILAEDTRHSVKLLQHYKITKPLISFHQFNEAQKEEQIIADLKMGKNIALISDAGTPLISDPGEQLIKRIVAEGLEVTSVPGPCAAICALTLIGSTMTPFQFIGFLPRKKQALQEACEKAFSYPGITIAYESPERILKTLAVLATLAPERHFFVARELTKKFETLYRGSAKEISKELETNCKGEFVLLMLPHREVKATYTLDALIQRVQEYQKTKDISLKEAIALVAKETGVSKRLMYQTLHRKQPQ